MQNNGEERIHYRIKSKQTPDTGKCTRAAAYALTALSASVVTATAIAVCMQSSQKSCIFGKRYFTKSCI